MRMSVFVRMKLNMKCLKHHRYRGQWKGNDCIHDVIGKNKKKKYDETEVILSYSDYFS